MKIKRRGFVAMAVLFAHQALGKNNLISFLAPSNNDVSKLKKIFALKKYFFQRELKALFKEKFDSFQKLGYKNSLDGCLMNDTKTYAIYPIELVASDKRLEQSFLLFSKGHGWSYVGVWNKYEMSSYLDFVEEINADVQLAESLLPTERKIDGALNPFLNGTSSFSFKTNINKNGVVCKIKLEGVKFINHQEFQKTFKI